MHHFQELFQCCSSPLKEGIYCHMLQAAEWSIQDFHFISEVGNLNRLILMVHLQPKCLAQWKVTVGERIQKFLDGKLLAIPFEICTNMARHSLVHKGPLAMLWKSFTTKLCVHACLLAFYFLRVIVHHQIEFMRSMDRSIIDSDSNMVT